MRKMGICVCETASLSMSTTVLDFGVRGRVTVGWMICIIGNQNVDGGPHFSYGRSAPKANNFEALCDL